MSLEEWNERYRQREEILDTPAPLLQDYLAKTPPGRALDLACGAGRNAIWLARNEWDVVAVDGASEAIQILRDHEPRVETHVLDLERGAPLPFPDASFDLVVILYYLHRPLFAEAQRVLKPRGLFVTAVRTRNLNPRYCVRPRELPTFFQGWELLHSHEDDIAEVVARKP
jgi:SAM-dependent methyltransferase